MGRLADTSMRRQVVASVSQKNVQAQDKTQESGTGLRSLRDPIDYHRDEAT
jgi:hypothetical protein